MAKSKAPAHTDNEIRGILLQYFYDRNKNATSARGKKGSAVKISDVKKELKASHFLTQQEVQSNLTYLISQGWVQEQAVEKSFTAPGGTVIPSSTSFYQITAAGIDKIDGPGEFTMPRFHGINIQATGQNIITLGDGNQVDARYSDAAGALVDLKNAILESEIDESQKLAVVADIDTIQSQLAKPEPNRSVIRTIWSGVEKLATAAGLAVNVAKVAGLLGPLL
jgi:hypothetical protein